MDYEMQQLARKQAQENEDADAARRSERADELSRFLKKTNVLDFFQKRETEEADFDDFKSFLIRLNGILRGIPTKDRKFDGVEAELSGGLLGERVVFPRWEDKEPLLRYAFDCAHELSREDASYMIPLVVNALHLFNDGNGRVSRVLHLLLSPDNNTSSFETKLMKTLSKDGRFDSMNISPEFINFEIEKCILVKNHNWGVFIDEERERFAIGHEKAAYTASAEFSDINTSRDGYEEGLGTYEKLRETDHYYMFTAVVEGLNDEEYDSICKINAHSGKKMISPILMQSLSTDNWERIFKKYYALKREHVETMVRMFEKPHEYLHPFDHEMLKGCFIRKVKEDYETNHAR